MNDKYIGTLVFHGSWKEWAMGVVLEETGDYGACRIFWPDTGEYSVYLENTVHKGYFSGNGDTPPDYIMEYLKSRQ